MQTGLGPFLAAYLASVGWNPGRVGFALTLGGVLTVLLQTPAGALVDRVRAKRAILVAGVSVLACGAVLLASVTAPRGGLLFSSAHRQCCALPGPYIGGNHPGAGGAASIRPAIWQEPGVQLRRECHSRPADRRCDSSFSNRAVFFIAAALAVPTILSVLAIRGNEIDDILARGGAGTTKNASSLGSLAADPTMILFLICAFLFHFANAAMLPQLGEMLSHGSAGSAAPFMSACIIVTQVVITLSASSIGRIANVRGRKPLLLLGFGVLPLRALLYTLTHWSVALIAIQILDGIANAIFGVVAILVVADRARGTGRFNLMQGALATAVGLGAALSTAFGGKLVQHFSFRVSFLSLGLVAVVAFLVLLFAIPETLAPQAGSRRGDIGRIVLLFRNPSHQTSTTGS